VPEKQQISRVVAAGQQLPAEWSFLSATSLIGDALKGVSSVDSSLVEAAAMWLHGGSHPEPPSARASAMVDAARYFYLTGRAETGCRVAEMAKSFSVEHGQADLTTSAAMLIGVCAADSGNIPRAMEAYAEALNLAQRAGNTAQELKIWLNLGNALMYSGLLREASNCYRRVVAMKDLLGGAPDAAVATVVAVAHMNIALCCLHLDDIGAGLSEIRIALEALPVPTDLHSIQNRVLAENYHVRLLIEIDDFQGALAHARAARELASTSTSPRADIQASVAEGLAEAFSGQSDLGISRLVGTLDRAKALKLASREVLVALVKALEYAGRHDEALQYLNEMLVQQRASAEANALRHVHTHLAKLHGRDPYAPMEDIKQAMRRVETQVEVVEGRVAKAEVIRQRQELFKARVEAMERLAVAAELRDDSTGEHSYRVGRMACLLAKEAGCDDEMIFMIDIAARLHDVGKIGIPDGILLKPSGFNPSERLVMEMHAEIGADVLARSEIPHIKMAEEIARHHHERWDGSGYPAKIGGQEIPLAARITTLADVYDALTHKRPYKEAWTAEASLSEILSLRGKLFDPELTDLFLALVSRLRREHRDLDHHLGEAARASPFIQARGKIWETLKLAKDEYQQQFQRTMDLQR